MAQRRIGLRDIRKLAEGQIIWDDSVSGFGARRQRGTGVTYVLKYRTAEGRQRWFSIGRHGSPWTPDEARDEAVRLLGEVKRKVDPAAEKNASRNAATVSDLCDVYLSDAEAGRLLTRQHKAKRPTTVATDRGRIEGHIKPLLGAMSVAAATRQDIDAFMHSVAAGKTARKSKTKLRKATRVRGGKGAATRTVGLLGAIFAYAVAHGLRADNPVRGVVRFADGRRERRVNEDEYQSLGGALKAGKGQVSTSVLNAVWFLALTGWRRGEALGLRWSEVDLARRTAILAETKTGRSLRPLSQAACLIIQGQARTGDFVFSDGTGKGCLRGLPQLWARKLAKIEGFPEGITPHTLRHSFASLAGDLGFSESTIGALVGHKGRTTTSRYVHLADNVLLAAADAVADRTAELMGERKPGVVVELRQGTR